MFRQLSPILNQIKHQPPLQPLRLLNLNRLTIPNIATNREVRNISSRESVVDRRPDGWLVKKATTLRSRLGMTERPKAYYRLRGLEFYRGIETVDWRLYFKTFQMPDTFHSWFLVVELHMWMLNVRINSEGREGDYLKKFSIELMWEEAKLRAKDLEVGASSSAIRDAFDELYEEFMAAFVLYDHGLLTSDVELANALWYRFLERKCDDPEKVELLVRHVRKQIHSLRQLSKEDFVHNANVTWLPLDCKLERIR